MMKIGIGLVSVALLVLTISGCSGWVPVVGPAGGGFVYLLYPLTFTASNPDRRPTFEEYAGKLAPISEHNGRIFFYRPAALSKCEPYSFSRAIYLNNAFVGLGEKLSFFHLDRPAGQYTVSTVGFSKRISRARSGARFPKRFLKHPRGPRKTYRFIWQWDRKHTLASSRAVLTPVC